MKLEDPPQERRRFELIGAVMAAVIGATAIGFFAVVILSADEPGAEATPAPTIAETPPPSTPVIAGVAVTRPVDVRSGPSSQFAIVTRLAVTDSINVLGRSQDGLWLVVTAEDRPTQTGWIPLDATTGVDVGPLPVIAAPGATPPAGPATLSPDLPDLVISRVFAQQNTLWVEVLNQGVADGAGEFLVTIDGGEPVALEVVKPGEPLRPNQRVAGAVPGVYLQLRRELEVVLQPIEGVQEEDTANNTWIGLVGPDAPNDVEIVSAAVEDDDAHLVVTLRNNSPIPVVGTFTVSVREAPPGTALIGRERQTVEIAPGGTAELAFEEITEIDLTRVTVILSTDAIEDAVIANNTYPR
ncbi:MAG: SH3 domain-containing protein [Dehalococcoidia bacterium]